MALKPTPTFPMRHSGTVFDAAHQRVPKLPAAARHRLRQAPLRNKFPKRLKKETRLFETTMEF